MLPFTTTSMPHHSSRCPRPGTYGAGSILLDFRNNLIYNGYGYSASDPVRMNYVGNYFKHSKLDKVFRIGGVETKIYLDGTMTETAKGGALGGWELISKAQDANKMSKPFDVAAVTTDTSPEGPMIGSCDRAEPSFRLAMRLTPASWPT